MELSGYLAIARRWWWMLIVAAWVAGLAGFIVASGLPPTYESQVKVLVGPINTDTDTLRASGQLVQTYAQVVTTEPVLESTIKELRVADLSPADFRSATRATANDVTRILTIRVQAGDPKRAADLANTLATELEQLTSQGLSRPEGLIQIVEFAQPTTSPVAPQVSLIVILAALAGIVVAVIIVLLLEYFGTTIRSREELASVAAAPLLGAVAAPAGDRPHPADLVVDAAPDSRAASAYRLTAAKLAFGGEPGSARSFIVTESDRERESAIVAANLAAAFARLGQRVVLIDGAGSGGSITRLYDLAGAPGLADVLDGSVRPVTGNDRQPGVEVLPGGTAQMEIVDPARVGELVGALTSAGRAVVIAAAPIRDAPMTLTLARASDGVVLVARRDRAHREDVVFASDSIKLVGARLVGVILTERSVVRGRVSRDAGARAARLAEPLRLATASRSPEPRPTPASPSVAPARIRVSQARRASGSSPDDRAIGPTDPVTSS